MRSVEAISDKRELEGWKIGEGKNGRMEEWKNGRMEGWGWEEWKDGFGGAEGPGTFQVRIRASIGVIDLEGCGLLQPPEPNIVPSDWAAPRDRRPPGLRQDFDWRY